MTRKYMTPWKALALGALLSLPLVTAPALAGDTLYKYDAQGRVIEVTYANGAKVTYVYDAVGNRTQVIKTL